MGVTYTNTVARTYERIASATVASSGTKTIDITSIPQGYTDMIAVCYTRRNAPGAGARGINMSVNGSSTTNVYAYGYIDYGQGATPSAAHGEYDYFQGGTAFDPNSYVGGYIIYFNDYTNTNFNKNMTTNQYRWQSGTYALNFYGNRWKNSSAINRLTINEPFEGFVAGDEVTIYGILAG